ncbi:hypothetical protein ACFLZZ_03890 [Nanoarchaeota archaeon]
MKKSVLFSLVLALILSMSLVSAAWPTVIGNVVERCTQEQWNDTRDVELESGCGNQTLKCTYTPKRDLGYTPPVAPRVGFWWEIISFEPGTEICCDPAGGYETFLKECGDCSVCGNNAACDVPRRNELICSEGDLSGYCRTNVCEIDNENPQLSNNQENLYIRDISNRAEIGNIELDIDFFDNERFGKARIILCDEDSSLYFVNRSRYFPAPEIIDGCAVEEKSLSPNNFTEDWKLSLEMWDWILDTVLNQGKVSMNIELIDGIGNEINEEKLFYIISDFTPPEVSISHRLTTVSGGTEVELTALTSDMFEDFELSIFLEGAQVGEICTESPCIKKVILPEGSFSYYAYALDPSGNNATTTTGVFTIETAVSESCEELLGQVCGENKICDESTFAASDSDFCCAGSCVSETTTIPTCEEQEGKVFNKNTYECNGQEVPAGDINELLRCCVGEIEKIPDLSLLEVSWKDENGNKLASASFGQEVRCSASGTLGKAEFVISKTSILTEGILSLPNSLNIAVSDTGIYDCIVRLKDVEKVAKLRVIEAPAQPQETALPGFGFFNALIALSFILAYYIWRKNE